MKTDDFISQTLVRRQQNAFPFPSLGSRGIARLHANGTGDLTRENRFYLFPFISRLSQHEFHLVASEKSKKHLTEKNSPKSWRCVSVCAREDFSIRKIGNRSTHAQKNLSLSLDSACNSVNAVI